MSKYVQVFSEATQTVQELGLRSYIRDKVKYRPSLQIALPLHMKTNGINVKHLIAIGTSCRITLHYLYSGYMMLFESILHVLKPNQQ